MPAYSLEKNPEEYLSCDLKQGLSAKPPPKNVSKLGGNVKSHMEMLVGNPNRVTKYFKHPDIQDAA